MNPPRFTHDCDTCRYLGHHAEFDLYFCARCDGGTVIARYGSEGREYASMPLFLLTAERLPSVERDAKELSDLAAILAAHRIVTTTPWQCLTCTRTGRGIPPHTCPSCCSEHDDNHGPHALEGVQS